MKIVLFLCLFHCVGPPGLEYLTSIDQLLVKQKVELLEAFTGFETNNKFTIKNSLGQKVGCIRIQRMRY